MSDFVHFKFETLFKRLLNTQGQLGFLFLSAFLSGCTFQARLLPTEQEIISSLKILNDSGPVSEANKSSYHIRGLCPAESSTVQFQSSSSTLPCNAGVFEGNIDLSSHPDGSLEVLIFTDNGHANNWRIIKDTVPPIVNIGTPIYTHTGLNRSISIPISLTDANAISFSSGLVDLSGTGVNGCQASLQGTGLTARQLVISDCSHSSGTLSVQILAGLIADEAGNSSLNSNTISGITIDNVAPTISETLTSSASGTNATTFEWDLQFAGADLIELTTSDVSLSGATTGCSVQLTGAGLSQRTLQITGCTGNGSLQVALPVAVAKDLANNTSASLNLTSVTIDNVGPTLALQSPTPASGNSGTTFNWVLDITGANAVNLSASDVTLTGASAGCTTSVSGSGLAQRTISVSGCTGSGSLGITVAAGIASDSASNLSSAITSSGTVTIVNTALTLSISSPSVSAMNSSNQAQFTLTYGNATNYTLTSSDIALNGANTGCTKALTGSGPTFTLTIANCSGNGNLNISVVSGTANDGSGNFAPAAGPSANVLVDNIKPTFTISGPTPTTGNSSTSFAWILTFSGVESIPLDNSFLTITGTNTGCSTSVSGTGATRTITMTGCSGNGSADIAINDGAGIDAAGNTSASVASLGAVTLDNTRPTLTIGAPTPTSGNNTSTFVWPITYSGANAITLNSGDVSLSTSLTGCTVAITTTGASTREVRITSCSGDGTLTFSLAANTASDTAGNTTLAAGPATSVTVDNVAPVLSIGTPTPLAGNSTNTFTWPLTFTGADFANLTAGSVDLIGATTGCSVNVTSSGVSSGSVEVSGCTGTGTLAIQIDAGVLTDFVGNSSVQTAASATVSINNAAPAIYVSGLPVGNNTTNSATSNTSGSSLVSYTFKIGTTASTDCSVASGYSSPQSLGNYSHDFTALPDESITACFKGQDSFGTYSDIFEHRWSRSSGGSGVAPGDYINICGQPPSLTYSSSTSNTSGILVDSGRDTGIYQNGEDCTYTITTGAPITVNFISFQSESGWDFLKVYDGTLSGTELVNRSGTGTGATYTANSGTMTLKWTSDGSVTQDGFVISWGGAAPSTGADLSPAPFAFNNVVNGLTNTVYTKATTITGISQAVFAGISGPSAQIRNTSTGSAWASWVMVNDGDSIEVRMTSGATNSENRTAQIQVGTFATTWSIYWDAVAPTGSISIAGGAAVATSTSTSLDLTANDSTLGAIEMYITQNASCSSDGIWETFTTPRSWTLGTESGTNTVYVKFRDEAGNVSPCYSDTILQDNQTAPVAVLSSTSPTNTNAASVPMTITFNEIVTGLSASDFVLVNATISGLSGSGKVYTANIIPQGPGTFSATLPANTVQDAFNNDSVASNTLSWFFDTIGPGLTLATNSLNVRGTFDVIVYTNDSTVTSIPTNALTVTNGNFNFIETKSNGVSTWFIFNVTPITEGNVNVYIAAGVVSDPSGNTNTISNTLSLNYVVPPIIQFNSGYSIVNETNGSTMGIVPISIQNAKPYPIDIKIVRHIEFSTAIPVTDHDIPAVSTLTIPANATSASFIYNITGDTLNGGNKTVLLSMTADNGGITFGTLNSHRILIRDDEEDHTAPLAFAVDSNAVITIDSNNKLKIIGSQVLVQQSLGTTNQRTPASINAANNYVFVSAGEELACAIKSDGELKCWGMWPTSSSSAGSTFFGTRDAGVSYKFIYSKNYRRPICGITSTDQLRCTGRNDEGQLLNGNTNFQTTFIDIDVGRTYKQVASSDRSICGITTTDDLYCWGMNLYGEVGVGHNSVVNVPTLVDSGTKYRSIEASWGSFCGITTANKLKCWGQNSGYLGTGGFSNVLAPASVNSSEDYQDVVMDLSAGTCALTTSGALKCWGSIGSFVDGGATDTTYTTPMEVQFTKTFQKISGRGSNFCALSTAGDTICIKSVNDYFGNAEGNTLKPANFVDNWIKLEAGYNMSCGLTATGIVKCSTSNGVPIGDGYSGLRRHQYLPVASSRTFIDISVQTFACAISSDGELYCWGPQNSWNPYYYGNSNTYVREPKLVQFAPKNLKKVYSANAMICVIDNDDDLHCKGRNDSWAIGNNTIIEYQDQFVKPSTSEKFKKISMVDNAVCGITLNDKLMCWGSNPGNGTNLATAPVFIDAANDYIDVSLNLLQRCAVTSTNVLKCWGQDDASLGLGASNTVILTPTVVDSGTGYKKVHTHYQQSSTCGITTSDQLKCMGWSFTSSPTIYDAGTTYVDTVGYNNNVCAKTTANTYKCWGTSTSVMAAGTHQFGFTILPKSY